MNLKQIQAFVAVARMGSVSGAAARLNTTQPAISMRLRELEKSIDAELIDRSRRSARLTPLGRDFLKKAEQIQRLTEETLTQFGASEALGGRIRLGVTETIAVTWLPELVGRINTVYPKVTIELDVGLTGDVWQQMNDGDCDLGLLPGPVGAPAIESQTLGHIRYDWMASPSLGIPDRTLAPKELSAWPIITLGRESNLHEVIEDWCSVHGVRPKRVDVCNSLGVVASLTIAGLGVALLPPQIFDDTSQLVPVETAPKLPDLEFFAAFSRNSASPLVRAIVEMAVEVSTFAPVSQH